mmetsp:Transcript_10593/g.18032  ORF Transcript_10593/g.18032 Transcript_10593/m.18032 type:complete len:117 (-) Transcript_10593:279-629(-)
MVYLDDWETFYNEAEKLFTANPAHTRYVMKYRHCDGKLVLKVTNDRVCLKYQTDQATDVKRLDKLNSLFLTAMCGIDPADETAADAHATLASVERPKSSEKEEAAGNAAKKRRGKR